MSDYMCPNCVTPWKCNGPHIPEAVSDRPIHEVLAEISAKVPPEEWAKLDKTHYADPDTLATLNRLERENADLREDNRKLALHTAAQATELADLRAKLEEANKWLDLLEVYMIEGKPRFAVHGYAGGPDYFDTARAAIDAAIAQGKGEK